MSSERLLLRRPRAEQDILELAYYYLLQADSLALFQTFVDSVERTLHDLLEVPEAGMRCGPFEGELRRRRIIGFDQHLVFYRLLKNNIEIVRVLHGAHDLDSILWLDPEFTS